MQGQSAQRLGDSSCFNQYALAAVNRVVMASNDPLKYRCYRYTYDCTGDSLFAKSLQECELLGGLSYRDRNGDCIETS